MFKLLFKRFKNKSVAKIFLPHVTKKKLITVLFVEVKLRSS